MEQEQKENIYFFSFETERAEIVAKVLMFSPFLAAPAAYLASPGKKSMFDVLMREPCNDTAIDFVTACGKLTDKFHAKGSARHEAVLNTPQCSFGIHYTFGSEERRKPWKMIITAKDPEYIRTIMEVVEQLTGSAFIVKFPCLPQGVPQDLPVRLAIENIISTMAA
jgi:hypothetical protein